MNQILLEDEIIIGTNYILQLKNKLGSGAFGDIYKGRNTNLHLDIAIKREIVNNNSHQRLKYEAGVLKYLQGGRYPPPIGIPAFYDFISTDNYKYLMMELLGPSLEDLFDLCNRQFSLKTILSLADQMICRIEFLHSRHFVHRDIKPDNFLIGLDKNKSLLYICDFGLCKKFRDENGKHIPSKEGKSLVGTARYASIYSHLGYEQSRRDDLESLVYSLIYFSRGSLPWMGIKAKNKKEKYNKIFDKKLSSTINFLCEKLPKEFIDFFHYIKELQYDEKPNYKYLKSLLGKMYDKNNFSYDMLFDFTDILLEKENKEKEKEQEKEIMSMSFNTLTKEEKNESKQNNNENNDNKNENNQIKEEEKKNNDNNSNKNIINEEQINEQKLDNHNRPNNPKNYQ